MDKFKKEILNLTELIMINKLIFHSSTLLILITSFLYSCSSKDSSNKDYIKYGDEFSKISVNELEYKIQDLDKRILQIKSEIFEYQFDRNSEIQSFDKDSFELKIIIENTEKALQKLNSDSINFENKILSKEKEYNGFILHNEFKIERSNLLEKKDKISRFKNSVDQMINSNRILDMTSIDLRLRHFDKDFEQLSLPKIKFKIDEKDQTENKKVLSKINNNLSLAENFLDSLISIQDSSFIKKSEEFQNELHNLKVNIPLISNKIIAQKNSINDYLERKETLKNIHNASLIQFDESIQQSTRRMYNKINEKYVYEIALIIKNLSTTRIKSSYLTEQINNLKNLQSRLVKALEEDNYNLAEKLIEDLKLNITKISKLVSESIKLGEIIKSLFKEGVFFDFMELADTTDSKNNMVKDYVNTFHAHIPTLKKFLEFYPNHQIFIDGHADRTMYGKKGPYENTRLSMKRAVKAKTLMIEKGIDSSKIIWDYYGKFHNLTPYRDFAPLEIDTVINRRIDIRVIPTDDSLKTSKDLRYLEFKNNLIIQIDTIKTKNFKHANGYWIEKEYEANNGDLIKVFYNKIAYLTLLNRDQNLKRLMRNIKSPIYEDGCLRLGNQVRLILNINGKDYKIEICEEGATTIDEIKNEEFKDYLLGIQPIAQK